ncbi:MAG: hypothetical protein XD40_1452 [Archaeoglobus fulgidus]|uniref:Uncharacterized protein n=1 Tax=Archaeoglobus fulgidus TaxID=2234 RepID=A0A101DD94_ARCFL|nr:hypothetical protein [Archaeoglobus fulgidus]KUJ93394.1 MAG: hypothetical protein XD40_1452 [Archaeoglobus fulgidus]KUK05689.1 MAG: Uncharacterized protein XD48_2069 [Archaeoglobus fulgidus]
MAKQMEKKSARLLAFLLALIMIGSVFAYMLRGGSAEHREVVYRLDDFREYVNWTPADPVYVQYYNLSYTSKLGSKDPLASMVTTDLQKLLIPAIFSRQVLEVTRGISQVMIVDFGETVPLYFVDAGMSKIYFAKEDEIKHGNFTLQVRRPGIALVSELSPLVVGYKPLVEKAVDTVEGNYPSFGNKTYSYLSRINGSFAYAFFAYGDVVKQWIRVGNESPADFFFEGYRYNFNNSSYEKVWAMHFEGNYFFGGMNESEKNFEYYKVQNFGDGLSVAVMEDKNFTKVVNARPNILTWQISFNNTQNEG